MKPAIIPKPKLPAIVKRLFEKPFSLLKINGQTPASKISDDEKAIELSIALPGFDRKEINVRVENQCLVIHAEKQNKGESNEKHWIRREFSYQKFYRAYHLPDYADEEKIHAELKNGILTIVVGKKAEAMATKKTIPIK